MVIAKPSWQGAKDVTDWFWDLNNQKPVNRTETSRRIQLSQNGLFLVRTKFDVKNDQWEQWDVDEGWSHWECHSKHFDGPFFIESSKVVLIGSDGTVVVIDCSWIHCGNDFTIHNYVILRGSKELFINSKMSAVGKVCKLKLHAEKFCLFPTNFVNTYWSLDRDEIEMSQYFIITLGNATKWTLNVRKL